MRSTIQRLGSTTNRPVSERFTNGKFAVEPREAGSAHRPWTDTAAALHLALASREERAISKRLTFSWNGARYCVKVAGPGTAIRGWKIEVLHYVDERVRHKGRVMDCTPFRTLPRSSPVEDEKTLDVRLYQLVAAAAVNVRHPIPAAGKQAGDISTWESQGTFPLCGDTR